MDCLGYPRHRNFPAPRKCSIGRRFVLSFAGQTRCNRRSDHFETIASTPSRRIRETNIMKAFIAACVAIGVLWSIDVEFNAGRYTDVIKTVVRSALSR